ncbi:putative acid phosphatase [Cytospora mali]|uniref:Acid phosphatase n=1 Tax=Cytospora mali TaxID=578113 RepID=A0A194V4Y9_CYTMA|nr:putative acid phosphatase [Valsa mali var. pyri (nom. inval.)]
MPAILRLLASLAGLVPAALALGTGENKFKIVEGGRSFDRFITIWLENQDFAEVIKDPDFRDLKREGILLTKYYAQTHPSQPNYIAAVGGDYFGLDHDEHVRIPENVSTIVDLFDPKKISWGGYFEDQPGPGFMGLGSTGRTGNGGWDYVRKHNPYVSYDSIANNGTRLWSLGSFGDFERDFAANQVPQFVFMSPNMMNDGHNTTLEFATSWTHTFLKPLLADGAFKERTLILFTYDESATYEIPNKIGSLLLGNAVPNALRGTEDDTYYTHYSILATMEHNWQLPNLGRYDVGANVFKNAVASIAGYQNPGDPDNLAGVDNSLSYPGFLNSNPGKWRPVPPPNLKLIGAGGLPVSDVVSKQWKSTEDEDTPYDGSGEAFDGNVYLPKYGKQEPNRVLAT